MGTKKKNIDYEKVIEAARSGELKELGAVLVFDNDSGYWRSDKPDLTEDEYEKQSKLLNERFGCPNGYGDLVDLAIACGINAEWC